MTRLSRAIVALALVGSAAVTCACSSDSDGSASPAAATGGGTTGGTAAPGGAEAPGALGTGPAGPACAGLPATGPGSLAAAAGLPAGSAIGESPLLTALTQAVLTANLVDVLNTGQDITVLAPADSAFSALDPAALRGLLADPPELSAVLTHHVLPGRLTPAQLVGRHTTLDGGTVTLTGSDAGPTVSADQTLAGAAPATVLCGVPTVDATVYVLDQVLAPPAR